MRHTLADEAKRNSGLIEWDVCVFAMTPFLSSYPDSPERSRRDELEGEGMPFKAIV